MSQPQPKPFCISKHAVLEAWERVKANQGAAGIDEETIQDFERQLKDNLYRIWNRMSSGSYLPPPVRTVAIPKAGGGERKLGIPTVADRVAQMVVKRQLEPKLEPVFHPDSYGYRPFKSAHEAVGRARQRCWRYDWVLDLDIKGFFDNIPHDLMMRAVRKHTQEKWAVLYIERWLQAPAQDEQGNQTPRSKGTPQGGVISPLLANLFLHYALDRWMARQYPQIPFERYADDAILHCQTREEAERLREAIIVRLAACGLELNLQKTKIVYCKDFNRKMNHPCVQFTFLGYTFRPRKSVDKYGRVYVNFAPAVSQSALKAMRQTIRGWHLQLKCDKSLSDLSSMFNQILRGWYQYYGKFHSSAMNALWKHLNSYLTRWLMRKYKRLARHKTRAWQALKQLAIMYPNAFVHWNLGFVPKAG